MAMKLNMEKMMNVLPMIIKNVLLNDFQQTPLIYGYHGIGKTQMMVEVINRLNTELSKIKELKNVKYELVTLEATQLSESEFCGMPVTVSGSVDKLLENPLDGTKIAFEKIVEIKYALHPVIKKCIDVLEKGSIPLLFIDEINRASLTVQNELMNFIQQKRVVDTCFGSSIAIVCAGNPANPDSGSYNVVEFDDAQLDRFLELELKPELDGWIQFASKPNIFGEPIIHTDILDFLLEEPKFFHIEPKGNGEKAPTPRSWEAVSKVYYNGLKDLDTESSIAVIAGLVGNDAAIAFTGFLESNKEKLDSAEALLDGDELEVEKLIDKYKEYSPSKQTAYIYRVINFILKEDNKKKYDTAKYHTKLSDFLTKGGCSKDTFIAILSNLISTPEYKSLYSNLQKVNKNLLKEFFEIRNATSCLQ